MMARKRGRASVVKNGEEGQGIRDILEKGDDDDFVVGDINPDSGDDFIVDPKNHKKKSKSKIRKSSKSSVGENLSQVPETSMQEYTTPSTSPMVIIKTCNEDFFEFMTKSNSDINSNQHVVERPKSVSTPEQAKSESIDEKEKFSTPVSSAGEGSCDKLVQRLVSDLVRSSNTPPTVSTNAGLVPMIPNKTTPRIESLAGVTISQPVSNHPPPVPSHKTTLARLPSGGGNLTRPGQLHNPGQARLTGHGPRSPVTRPGAPRMMRPTRPPGLGGPRPRATNPLEGPRTRATPRLVNVRSLTQATHSSMATPQQPPSQSRYIPPVVDLDLSPDRLGHDQYPAYPPGSEQMSPSLPCSSVVDKLSSLGVSLAQVNTAATRTKHGGMLPPGISITRITPSREENPSLSLPGLANALIHLGKAEGRRRMVQYNLTEWQVNALSDLGVKEVSRI